MGDALGSVWLGGASVGAQVLPMMATRGCERPGSGPPPGREAGGGAAAGRGTSESFRQPLHLV